MFTVETVVGVYKPTKIDAFHLYRSIQYKSNNSHEQVTFKSPLFTLPNGIVLAH